MSASAADPAALSAMAVAGAPDAPTVVLERCANCNAPLSGPYCSQCGQRHEPAVHSFWHFMREAFEDFTHADSRLWRTLGALSFRPGFLTREFLEGRRARYLPPVRLYLVLSVAFFLIAGVITAHSRTSAANVPSVVEAKQACAEVPQELPWVNAYRARFDAGCLAAIEDGGKNVDESVLHNVPRAMFLFLPLLGLVMKALYRRPNRHYVEHLLFFVHNHAFIFLVLAIYALLGAILPASVTAVVGGTLWIYVALYFYASMRRVYGQGWLASAGKLTVLGLAYLVLGGVMLAGIALYAMFTA